MRKSNNSYVRALLGFLQRERIRPTLITTFDIFAYQNAKKKKANYSPKRHQKTTHFPELDNKFRQESNGPLVNFRL